jgi:hypothetical protein
MVTEEDPSRRGHEIPAVGQALGRGGPAVVQAEDPVGEKAAVEAEGDQVGADGGHDEPRGADRLTPVQGQTPPADRAGEGDEEPAEFGEHGVIKA